MLLSRRNLLATAIAAAPFVGRAEPLATASASARLKVVIAGGHPGDPECGCGGTVARYTALGHEVVLLYLNRGQGFCGGAGLDRCGDIRTAEAGTACRILKARPAFCGQYDGRSLVDNSHYDEFRRLLDAEKADIVFTQWPIDTHRDHRAVSALTLDAWLRSGRKAALYFYEVAGDTMMFTPGDFVDISAAEPQKRDACYAHASQQPDKWYPTQVELTRSRGTASGFRQAEGFLRHWESKPAVLP